jgi:hypothetical protein
LKILAHAELQKNDYFFVNFCPEYVALEKPKAFSEQIWQLILIDMIPLSKFPDIQINKINSNRKVYMHLELYEHFRSGRRDTEINGFKENTFALGLMILEMAFDIDIRYLYESRYHMLKSKK